MTYSPECVAAFEAKFGGAPDGCERTATGYAPNKYHAYPDAQMHNAKLAAFAANWERVRELEEAIAVHKLRFCGDKDLTKEDLVKEDRALWKLLEKGND